jgi:hypothetical protein
MKRVLLLAVVVVALGATEAQAHTTITCEPCSYPYQQWVDEAKVPTPDVTLTVVEVTDSNGCPTRVLAYTGCTSEQLIWLDPQAAYPRHLFFHEVGHNFDTDLLPAWGRERFMSLYGLSGEWQVDTEPAPTETPSELFAEVYAGCAILPHVSARHTLGRWPIYGAQPLGGRGRYNRACRMIDRF